jgi:hypothetical protein
MIIIVLFIRRKIICNEKEIYLEKQGGGETICSHDKKCES